MCLLHFMNHLVQLLYLLFSLCIYMFAKDHGWKGVVRRWLEAFKTSLHFRCVFLFVLYTAMLLFRTLLSRNLWANPLSDIMGVWGLYNAEGEFTTEAIENLVLFIPFVILLFWAFREKVIEEMVKLWIVVKKSVSIVFLFSAAIEFLQLFLRLGTFQLSDLFYNTLGGLIGGLLYWIVYKVRFRRK